jgi:hypothetical protein
VKIKGMRKLLSEAGNGGKPIEKNPKQDNPQQAIGDGAPVLKIYIS